MMVFPLSKYNSSLEIFFLSNIHSFYIQNLGKSILKWPQACTHLDFVIGRLRVYGLQFALTLQSVSSQKSSYKMQECIIAGIFKILRLFSIYFRNIIYIKSNVPCIKLLVMFSTLCFPYKERLCFLSDEKIAASLDLILFTCISCFQLLASTCRTPSSHVDIGSCFKNSQASDLGLRQKTASVRSKTLATNYLVSGLFFSSEIFGSSLLAWFWSLVFFSPRCGHPPNFGPSLYFLSLAILESLNQFTDNEHEPRKVVGITKSHSDNLELWIGPCVTAISYSLT